MWLSVNLFVDGFMFDVEYLDRKCGGDLADLDIAAVLFIPCHGLRHPGRAVLLQMNFDEIY